jgi:hypothetical protein
MKIYGIEEKRKGLIKDYLFLNQEEAIEVCNLLNKDSKEISNSNRYHVREYEVK